MALSLGSIFGVLDLEDKFTGKLVKAAAETLTFAAAIATVNKALEAQAEQEKAINTLNLALANQGRLTKDLSDALIGQASALEQTTQFTDEQILAAQKVAAQYGFTGSEIQRLTNLSADLAAAQGIEVTGAMEQLVKAANGQMRGLKALGVQTDETKTQTQQFEQAVKQLEDRFSGQAQLATQGYAGQMAQLKKELDNSFESLGKFLGTLGDFGTGMGSVVDVVRKFNEFLGTDLVLAVSEARALFAEFMGFMLDTAATANDVLSKISFGKLGGDSAAIRLAAEDQRKLADELREQGNVAATSAGKLQTFTNAQTVMTRNTGLTTEELKKLKEQQEKALKVEIEYNRIQREGDEAFKLAGIQTYSDNLDKIIKQTEKLLDMDDPFNVNSVFGKGNEAGVDVIGPLLKKVKTELPALPFEFKKVLKASFADLPDVILGAIQGGGDVFKAIGAKLGGDIFSGLFEEGGKAMKFLTDNLGKTLGGALGSLAGPLGSIAGSLLGKGLDKLTGALGIGGNKVIMQVNDMRDKFFDSVGGFEELQKKLVGLSNQDLVKKIFDAKTVEQFNAAVNEVNGLLGNQQMAQDALNDAVERYGFTLEELPQKMKQDEINANFGQILQDFELLKAAGFDTNVILEKMGPNVNEFVNQAVAAGGTIPEALRPIIEQLIASGQLLDENGEAYTSVEDAGINFAQTMDEKFTTLIDKITQMVNALLGIPTDINTNVNVNTNYTSSGDTGQNGRGRPAWDEEFATGGIVTSPTVALVGEKGPEAITPISELPGLGGPPQSTTAELSDKSARKIVKGVRDALLQTTK